MKRGRARSAVLFGLATLAVLPACNRRKPAETNDIVPSISVNRSRAPLGGAIEVTYTWKLEPTAKKLTQDYKAFVHFLDPQRVQLFNDDHVPTPPPSSWEPGKTYSYTRTVFVPVYPYVGEAQVVVGLAPASGKGERVALKGEHVGLREFKVANIELLPQTENIFLVYKDGWHNPESSPQNPSLERTWTKKEALVSFKNPKKDVIVYLEADTNFKAFEAPPVLTVLVGGKSGLTVPIESSEVFLRKVRVKAADLGTEDWVDLRLSLSQAFVPKLRGVHSTDERELGIMVYHLYVAEADKMGSIPELVDATPVSVPSPAAAKPGTASAAKPLPAKPLPAKKS